MCSRSFLYRGFFVGLALLLSFSSEAAVVELFTRAGVRAPDYYFLLRQIQPGDILRFPDGREFPVRGILGEGSQSLVLDVGEGHALRLAARAGSLRSYVRGYEPLAREGVEVARVLEVAPRYEYVVSEKVPVRFDLAALLRADSKIEAAERGRALAALKDFALSAEPFGVIDDLHGGQVVWDGMRWVLLDWGAKSRRHGWLAPGYAVERLWAGRNLPRDLEKEIAAALRAKRRARRGPGCGGWFVGFGAGLPSVK
jgi:hypothetical protein